MSRIQTIPFSLPDVAANDEGGEINEEQTQSLQQQGFTTGLAKSLRTNQFVFPLRIWIIDNSWSMQTKDGQSLIQNKNHRIETKSCTRWDEIVECVEYHCEFASLMKAPTSFRFLNDPGETVGPQQFGIGLKSLERTSTATDLSSAKSILQKAKPCGLTPLTRHIQEIHANISSVSHQLTSEGKQIAIILATDGLPTSEDGHMSDAIRNEFISALRMLEGLPIWLVIRLCTDEENVVQFYNQLDEQLELSIEVLDDYQSEAQEVYEHNPWLTYALSLHRLREMGYHDRVFDLMDERALTKGELRDFLMLLFDNEEEDLWDDVPDPYEDWDGFMTNIKQMLDRESMQWNPIKSKMMPWINLDLINTKYA